jgi:hypothetical protein
VKAVVATHVDIDAPPKRVWDYVFDWPRQGQWIPATRVSVAEGDGRRPDGQELGAHIEAWTGVGPIGFLDTMTVTRWDVPRACDVEHTGRVIRGVGVFNIVELAGNGSRFEWREDLDLPLGWPGYIGYRALRPALLAGVNRALRTLKRQLEDERVDRALDSP